MISQVLEDKLTDQELVRETAYKHYWVKEFDRLGFMVFSKGQRQISIQFLNHEFEYAKLYIDTLYNRLDDMSDLNSLITTLKV